MKLFESLLENFKDLKKESYLSSLLLQYNVHNIFKPIYAYDNTVQRFGDVCTGFIILGYSNGCHWLDFDKDRRLVNLECIASVLEAIDVEMTDVWKVRLNQIIDGDIAVINECINDFVDWQKDSMFDDYITQSTYLSFCRKEGRNPSDITSKVLNDRGKFLLDTPQLRINLDNLIDDIKRKYSPLDEALKKENKTPISNRIEENSYEKMVHKRVMLEQEKKRRSPLPVIELSSGDKE